MVGIEYGDKCNRNGCTGLILEREIDGGCYCHLTPPCSYCVEDRRYCEKCGWEGKDEQVVMINNHKCYVQNNTIQRYELRELDETKIDYHTFSHTHFSMKIRGVYPKGTTIKQVEKEVKGTFGGRFNSFGDGKFEYIAYTD